MRCRCQTGPTYRWSRTQWSGKAWFVDGLSIETLSAIDDNGDGGGGGGGGGGV